MEITLITKCQVIEKMRRDLKSKGCNIISKNGQYFIVKKEQAIEFVIVNLNSEPLSSTKAVSKRDAMDILQVIPLLHLNKVDFALVYNKEIFNFINN